MVVNVRVTAPVTSSSVISPSASADVIGALRIMRYGISTSSPACKLFTPSRSPKIQSEMTKPTKPHSSRKMSEINAVFSPHHSPFTELYAVMTQATPSSTIRLKCGRYTSCNARSSMLTSTPNRAFSIEFSAKCLSVAMTWR